MGAPRKKGKGGSSNGNGRNGKAKPAPSPPAEPRGEPSGIIDGLLGDAPRRSDLALIEQALRHSWPAIEQEEELAKALKRRLYHFGLKEIGARKLDKDGNPVDDKYTLRDFTRIVRIINLLKRTELDAIKIAAGQAVAGVNVNVGVGVSTGGATPQEVAAELEKDPRFVEFARSRAIEDASP